VKAPIQRGGLPLKQQHAEHVRLIPYLAFRCSLVLLFACLTSSVQAASPSTSITGNTVTGNFTTQIVPPPQGGKVYGIQGGQTVGTNLFHSFGQFNVGAGDTAQFQTSNLSQNAAISNILGRVNGQQSASQIFGTIDSVTFYPSANLFLMNPYGFLFGPVAVCPQHKHLWTVGAEPPSSVPAPEASPNR